VTPTQPLSARLYATSHECLPVLLYLHGGGFVIGSPNTHDSLCRQLALRSGVAVLSLAYRLAPEHRFPSAVDDTWAALRHLALHAGAFGLDGSRLAVGGDSAGGTLAAVAALQARDAGLPLALQLLITPGTAAFAQTASRRLFANGFLLDARGHSLVLRPGDRTGTTAVTGDLRRWRRTTWTASRRPACCWPSATPCLTRAWPTATACERPASPSSWRSGAASRTISSRWAAC
jgi:acetyl esterase/lipase